MKRKTMKTVLIGTSIIAFYFIVMFLFSWFIPKDQRGAVQASTSENQLEQVFQVLADEGRSHLSGRNIWIKNTKTGECFLVTQLASGVAQSPALCEKGK